MTDSEKIQKLEEQILKLCKTIDGYGKMINHQTETISDLTRWISANTTINNTLWPMLIKSNPVLQPLYNELLTNLLKFNGQSELPNKHIETQLNKILELIQPGAKPAMKFKVIDGQGPEGKE